jgi:hypothetical protein
VCVREKDVGAIAVAFSTGAGAALACGFGFIAFDTPDSMQVLTLVIDAAADVESQMQRM